MYCSVFLKAVTLAVKGEHAGKRLVMEIWQSLWVLSLVRFSSVSPLSPCSGEGRRMLWMGSVLLRRLGKALLYYRARFLLKLDL